MTDNMVYPLAQAQWDSPDGCRDLLQLWQTAPGKLVAEQMVGRLVKLRRPKTIVDLGCGSGRLIPHLGAFKMYRGYDTCVTLLGEAISVYGTRRRVAFSNRDIRQGAPDVQPVDLVLSVDTSCHYMDPLGWLAEIMALWPARAYLFNVLHGPKTLELINGKCLATADVATGLPRLGYVVAQQDQELDGDLKARYVLLGGSRG